MKEVSAPSEAHGSAHPIDQRDAENEFGIETDDHDLGQPPLLDNGPDRLHQLLFSLYSLARLERSSTIDIDWNDTPVLASFWITG